MFRAKLNTKIVLREIPKTSNAKSLSCAKYGQKQPIGSKEYFEIRRIFDEIQFSLITALIKTKSRFQNDLTLDRQRKFDRVAEDLNKLL